MRHTDRRVFPRLMDRGYCEKRQFLMSKQCAESCNFCSHHKIPITRTIGWSEWGAWSICDVICGEGVRYRSASSRDLQFSSHHYIMNDTVAWCGMIRWCLKNSFSRSRTCLEGSCFGDVTQSGPCVVENCPKGNRSKIRIIYYLLTIIIVNGM